MDPGECNSAASKLNGRDAGGGLRQQRWVRCSG